MSHESSNHNQSEQPVVQGNQGERPEDLTEKDLARIETQANTNAFSRAIAVMILMCVPGVLGHYLDTLLGTQFFILVGFVFGMIVAIWGLLYVSRIADATAKRNRELKQKMKARDQSSPH
jgi:F0F1-type ATP synthase assembly protein I